MSKIDGTDDMDEDRKEKVRYQKCPSLSPDLGSDRQFESRISPSPSLPRSFPVSTFNSVDWSRQITHASGTNQPSQSVDTTNSESSFSNEKIQRLVFTDTSMLCHVGFMMPSCLSPALPVELDLQ